MDAELALMPITVKNNPAADFFDPASGSWTAESLRNGLMTSLESLASDEITAIQVSTPHDVNGVESVLDGEKKNDYYAASLASGDTSLIDQIDSAILDPRSTWADKDEYDRTAQRLVQLFVDNFAQFEAHVDEGVRKAAPQAA